MPGFVDDPAVADPKASKATEFAFQRRALQRVFGELAKAAANEVPVRFGKTAEFAGGRASSEALPQTDETCFGTVESFDRHIDRLWRGQQLKV